MQIEQEFIQDFEAYLSFKKFQDLMKKKVEDKENKENESSNAGNLRRIIESENGSSSCGKEKMQRNLRRVLEPLESRVGGEEVEKSEAEKVVNGAKKMGRMVEKHQLVSQNKDHYEILDYPNIVFI